ncbi:MAG: hypothetical protein R3A79_25950 [Nannocystaceae bacterium]
MTPSVAAGGDVCAGMDDPSTTCSGEVARIVLAATSLGDSGPP